MTRVLLLLVLGFSPLVFSADKSTFCRALIADRADVAVERNSPIERWIQNRGETQLKINPKLQFVFVVPVYKELNNGYLERLLARIHNQDAPHSQVRVVLIVNNTLNAAGKRRAAFLENQQTLAYLKDLMPEQPLRFPHWRRAFDRRVLGNGILVDVLDHSTVGTARLMGPIRKIGETHAFATHKGDLDNLIVHHFDADSLVSHRHFSLNLQAFSDSSVQSFVSFMEFRLPKKSSAELHSTFFRERGAFGRDDRKLAMSGVVPYGGTPRISVRGSALQAVGGMSKAESCEDVELLQALDGLYSHRAQWRFPVITADRARIDGFDAADRERGLRVESRPLAETTNVHAEEFSRVLRSFEFLKETLPEGELALLRAEFEFWHAQAVADLSRGRDGDPFWETFGGSEFASRPNLPGVSWHDVTFTSPEHLSLSVRVGIYNRTLARFYALARDYPEEFPRTFREAQLSGLRRNFADGFGAGENPSAKRARKESTLLLANGIFSTDEALNNGAEISRTLGRYGTGSEAWLKYLCGKWQQSVGEYDLSLEQERALIQNARFIFRQALLSYAGDSSGENIGPLVREIITGRADEPRTAALLVVAYRHLLVSDREEMQTFALETIKPRYREHLRFLISTEERSD